jgi:hypothetical protein
MRVLVTGGAGFIGSAVCLALVKREAFVVNVDKLTYAANPRSLDAIAHHPHYAFERRDICDRVVAELVPPHPGRDARRSKPSRHWQPSGHIRSADFSAFSSQRNAYHEGSYRELLCQIALGKRPRSALRAVIQPRWTCKGNGRADEMQAGNVHQPALTPVRC